MSPLYMVEMQLDLAALLRFLTGQGLNAVHEDEDSGYGAHAWLAAGFGELAPRPWRLFVGRGRPPRILGYSQHDATVLQQRLREFADPAVLAVCADPAASIASRMMPSWTPGRRLAFELRCCPVGRKAGTGIEKDLFLIRADAAGDQGLRRDTVYCDWVCEQLERDRACSVHAVQVAGFRLVRQTRRVQGSGGPRTRCHPVRPDVLVRGELTVTDPEAFATLLGRGVGRHRAFGYGMLLLRPPS